MYKAFVSGVGSYVPERRLTNFDLEQMVDTSNDWIMTRTGIAERRIAADHQATSDLAFEAARNAIRNANLTAEDIDMIIVATVTPDHPFPAVACQLQSMLGCRIANAFDVQATCVGFLSALQIAEQFVKNGRHRHVLVVGAETLSRITDYSDRGTGILFGDGAGAFVVSRGEDEDNAGIIHTLIQASGEHFESLYIPAGGSRLPLPTQAARGTITMEGSKIFKLSVNLMSSSVRETLRITGYTVDDIDWVIPHQANQRIIDGVAKQLRVPNEKMISTIKYFGNNAAATIPLAIDTAIQDGRIKRGDTLMLAAFGGGLIWGSLLMQY